MNIRLHELLTKAYKSGLGYTEKFSRVEGWLSDVEAFILYHYALYHGIDSIGEIVEIGTYKGKSTCWLVSGLKDSGITNMKINCVDPFTGSPEFVVGQRYTGAGLWTGSSLTDFKANMEKFGFSDMVNPIIKTSRNAVKEWTKPIGLLFIDGDHAYDEARFDFKEWTKFVPIGGTVLMHDATTWVGPRAVVNEFITGNPDWETFSMDSLVVATKVK